MEEHNHSSSRGSFFGGLLSRKGFNELFEYRCTKHVLVRDARVGLMYWVFMGGIAMYVIDQICGRLVHYKFDTPRFFGAVRVAEPTQNDCKSEWVGCFNTLRTTTELPYCCNGKTDCEPVEDDRFVFKGGACKCPGRAGHELYCMYTDGHGVAQELLDQAVIVKTKLNRHYTYFNKSCDHVHSCPRSYITEMNRSQSYYIADIERFNLKIRYSMAVRSLDISLLNTEADGFLKVLIIDEDIDSEWRQQMKHALCRERADALDFYWKGKPTNKAPCFLKVQRALRDDVISMDTMLRAAAVDLDHVVRKGSYRTIRSEGFTMHILTEFHNVVPWYGELPKIIYVYDVFASRRDTFNDWTISHHISDSSRVIEGAHGILITLHPAGKLGRISCQGTVTLLATVAFCFFCVEFVMRRVVMLLMSRRYFYLNYIYQVSGNFGYMHHLGNWQTSEIKAELVRRNLRNDGERPELMYRLIEAGWKPEQESSAKPSEGQRQRQDEITKEKDNVKAILKRLKERDACDQTLEGSRSL